MKYNAETMEKEGILTVARLMCLAARTAPKARGIDNLDTLVLTGEEKEKLADEMKRIGEAESVEFFIRDSENMRTADAVVLIGTVLKRIGIPICGLCGFKDCGENEKNGSRCAFNSGDLGIALGSAAAAAADNRADCRVMFTAGRAAVSLRLMKPEVEIAFGIPLKGAGKNPFFDRK